MLQKATQLLWLGFLHRSCSQNPCLIQTWALFSPLMQIEDWKDESQKVSFFRKRPIYACKGPPWPRQVKQVIAEPILAVMKAAAEMMSHKESCASKMGLTSSLRHLR